MREGFLDKNYKRVVTILGIVFLLVSIYIHTTGDYFWYRISRGIIIFFFLGLLLYFKSGKANRVLLIFLIFYGASSLFTIWYENVTCATWAMILNFVAYIILVVALISKVNFRKMNSLFVAVFAILIAVNGYLLYELVMMIKDLALSNLHYIFILLGAMCLAVVGFLSLLYNHKYSSKASLLFTFFVFSLVFGEVFRSIGYYDFAYGDISVYIARGLLIVALSMLLNHAISDKTKAEQLGIK